MVQGTEDGRRTWIKEMAMGGRMDDRKEGREETLTNACPSRSISFNSATSCRKQEGKTLKEGRTEGRTDGRTEGRKVGRRTEGRTDRRKE
jgi:hypothetical protein